MLLPQTYPSDKLIEALKGNPFSKATIIIYLDCFKQSQGYLDRTIFNRLRRRIEKHRGAHLDLRNRLQRAEAGRYIIWCELSYRNSLPSGWQSLHLLQFTSHNSSDILETHKHFIELLKQGKILDKPSDLNGMQNTPLFKVFGCPTTLDQLQHNYKLLRIHHHPDISPYDQQEANDRFHWLNKAYQGLCDNWSRFNPASDMIPRERINKQFNQQLTFTHGWWYWFK